MNIIEAHKSSFKNKEDLLISKKCGCFYCLRIFEPIKIEEWLDNEETAICPYCGIDSVIGDSSGYTITRDFLEEMNRFWF